MTSIIDRFFSIGQPRESRMLRLEDGGEAARFPVGSSEWWLHRLIKRMQIRNIRLERLRSYYRGTNKTWQFASDAHRETFGEAFRDLRANFAKTVVEAVEQRMAVQGFTIWDDDERSETAWEFWQQNALDARSVQAHIDALSTGLCPVIVNPLGRQVAPGIPLITVEDPLQVIVEYDLADRRVRMAALKLWTEDDGRRVAVLYLPDRVEWWRTTQKYEEGRTPTWESLPDEGGPNRLRVGGVGVVPVVELQNIPEGDAGPVAEHESIESQLDIYATELYNMVTASYHLSFPQRTAAGVDFGGEDQERDEEGRPTIPGPGAMRSGPNRIVWTPNPEAKFDQWEAATLESFVTVLREMRHDMAITTSTPPRLLVPPPTSVGDSGESIVQADLPLSAKVSRRETSFGNAWETVKRLAFLARGDLVGATRMDMETEWRNPDQRPLSELADALVKLKAMGIPQEELWRRAGATPQQIRRWRHQRQLDLEAVVTAHGGADEVREALDLLERPRPTERTEPTPEREAA